MLEAVSHHFPKFAVDLARLCLWLAILTAVFIPLERLFALHPSRIWRKGIGADLTYYFFSGLVAALLLSVPLGYLAWVAHRFVPYRLRDTIGGISFWPRALLALVVAETGYYWGHRLMHAVPFLWRFHAIHHSPDHIDFLVNSRAHPLDLAFGRLCALSPLYVLGLAQPATAGGSLAPALITVTGMVWAFFVHANVKWRFGPLEWIVATPGFHHWHHAMDPADRNFASMLPVLDRIFGTMHLPKGQWPARYGIQGVVPASLADQLIRPLVGSFPLERGSASFRDGRRRKSPADLSLKQGKVRRSDVARS